MQENEIVFLDSGVGGISTLAEAQKLLPSENFIYYADAANAPYGDKELPIVCELTKKAADFLLGYKPKALVIACNTATAAAVADLRALYSLPIVGLEPALKPALKQEGKLLILGTALTVQADKLHNLLNRYAENRQVIILSGSGLVELIEEDLFSPKVERYLKNLLDPLAKEAAGLILGCTHYVFLRPILQRLYPSLPLFDGNEGAARRLRDLLAERNLLGGGSGQLEFFSSFTDPFFKEQFAAKCERFYRYCFPLADQAQKAESADK